MTYEESLGWLYSTQQFGIKLGLDNIRRVLKALGDPHEQLSVPARGRNERQGLGLRYVGGDSPCCRL